MGQYTSDWHVVSVVEQEIPYHRSDEERLMRRRRCMHIANDIREPAQILFI